MSRKSVRILLVDDDITLVSLIRDLLEVKGYVVDSAHSFEEAEADIRENLKNTKQREAEKKYTDSLKAKATIVYPPGKEPKPPGRPPMGPGKTAPAPTPAPSPK